MKAGTGIETNDRVVSADRKVRSKVLSVLAVCAVLGLGLYHFLSSYMEALKSLADTDPELALEKFKHVVAIFMVGNGIVSSGFSAYFVSRAVKTWKSGRYPPPGARVIKDTRVRVGRQAGIMAVLHLIIAALALSTNFLLWRIYHLVETLMAR